MSLNTFWSRLRVMDPAEILARVTELSMDYCRYYGYRWFKTPALDRRECLFKPLIDTAPDTELAAVWQDNAWHDACYRALKSGVFQVCDQDYTLTDAPWHYCPIRDNTLSRELGRTFLFIRMYKLANMLYLGTLNRHYHLNHKAKAVRLGLEAPEFVLDDIHAWIRENPYMAGVNWADSLHCATRVVNWALAFNWMRLDTVPADIAESVHHHGLFIEKHLSFGSSAGNHLLGELWGLLITGLSFPTLPRSAAWVRLATEGLARELARQFDEDGFHMEKSVSYQRLILEYLLLVILMADNAGHPLPAVFRQVTLKALVFLRGLLNNSGEVPLFGDNGHENTTDIHYQSYRENDLYRSLFLLAHRVFPDAGLLPAGNTGTDQRVIWLTGIPAPAGTDRAPDRYPALSAYRQAGLFRLYDDVADTAVIIRAGNQGYGICAHAHADLLSFVASIKGRQFFIDPGTFGYHPEDPAWRDYFRSTPAHNTLSIDGLSQAKPESAMIWRYPVAAILTGEESGSDRDRLAFSLDAWRYLDNPVQHQRSFMMDRSAHSLEVTDSISPGDNHAIQLCWHLHPDVSIVDNTGHRLVLLRDNATCILHLPASGGVEIFKGNDADRLGWYSPYFEIRIPSYTIRFRDVATGEKSWVSRIDYGGS